MFELISIRVLLVLILGAMASSFSPFGIANPWLAAAAGAVLAGAFIVLEARLRSSNAASVAGGFAGLLAGLLAALLANSALRWTSIPDAGFLGTAIVIGMAYLGVILGSRSAVLVPAGNTPVTVAATGAEGYHIVDTSVIIDGRIADIAETGFLDGTLAIPQFVLRELQLVADSADSLKRNRGRRGLDVLQKLQKMTSLKVVLLDEDFPHIRDVDMKLIELGRKHGAKVLTNDFNLNKVAQLHGVSVLNINELANALKPIVLPGEVMRVFVLKEGKEYNQGVAYLDDGTMVVVDNARKQISKTIDIAVTSVLQTTAGKMIFGRFDERSHAVHEKLPSGAAREASSAAAPAQS